MGRQPRIIKDKYGKEWRLYKPLSRWSSGQISTGCPFLDSFGYSPNNLGIHRNSSGATIQSNPDVIKKCTDECPFNECVLQEEE